MKKIKNKMYSLKNILIFVVTICCVFIVEFKINIQSVNVVEIEQSNQKIRVAFSMAEGNNPWVTNLLSNLEQCAEEFEMELVYHEPEQTTSEWQREDLLNLLTEDIDYLAVFPKEENVLSGVLEIAEQIGLPVIVISKDISLREKCAALISVDYEAEGRVCAQVLANTFKGEKANVVIIKGPENSSVAVERLQGFTKELKNYPNLQILEIRDGEFDRLTAEYVMEDVISTYGNGMIQAVFASSDEEGMGVLQALKITDYLADNDVKIVSINGNQDSLKAIVAGEYTASVESSIRMGNVIFELVQRMERNFNKSKYIVIPYQVYDAENAEKYLSSLY